VIGLFVALFSRLWFLQVLAGDRYVELADTNRLRTVVTEAPRGASSPRTAGAGPQPAGADDQRRPAAAARRRRRAASTRRPSG
jgi:cell division protein FtsI/penicillin-binding protein 2